ncbi:hypothetical protein [Citrobacter amalonaticus]|uniref:hypothetical protein n=1 Tax=Citrobacter amalonaticus TaxID=35703 RepID=UPI0012D2D56B|nr:hypothetical protein [Citrobacter amalonaticus]
MTMKYRFISDDVFFLKSLQLIIGERYQEVAFIDLNKEWAGIKPNAKDAVVVAVDNNHLRSCLLKKPVLLSTKLIVLVDIPLTPGETRCSFPCLLSKKIRRKEFIELLDDAENIPLRRKITSLRAVNIFTQLCYGGKIPEITGPPGLTTKSIYRIKRDVLQEYGLTKCNSVGVLICRDLLVMSTHLIDK